MLALAVAALAMPIRAFAHQAFCQELWNPHGQTTPPAGNTTCPGSKGGQNEDGFYQVGACDGTILQSEGGFGGPVGNPIFAEPLTCDGTEGAVFLIDGCGKGPTGWIFKGPLPILDPTVIKYTETGNGVNGAPPTEKKIGNLDNPNADGVYKHYFGHGDLMVCDAASLHLSFRDANHDGIIDNLESLQVLVDAGECTCCYVPPPPKDSDPSNPNTSCPPLSIK